MAQREKQFAPKSDWQHRMIEPARRKHTAFDQPFVRLVVFVDWLKALSDDRRMAQRVLFVLVDIRVQAAHVDVLDLLTTCNLVIQLDGICSACKS